MQTTLFILKIFSEMSVEEAKRKAAFAAVDNHVKKGQVEPVIYFLIKKIAFWINWNKNDNIHKSEALNSYDIDKYRGAANITEYHNNKLILRRIIIAKFMMRRQEFHVKMYVKCQK